VTLHAREVAIGERRRHRHRRRGAADDLRRVLAGVAGARTRAQGGVGIGLSLVKGLVDLHGGRVSARSLGLDQGSTFEVRLPLARVAGWRRAGAGRSGRGGAARPPRVIADDNRDGADS
jgi:hypothetical protein